MSTRRIAEIYAKGEKGSTQKGEVARDAMRFAIRSDRFGGAKEPQT
jgi:hypothetical protein